MTITTGLVTKHDIVIRQGSVFTLNISVKNSDGTIMVLTGYSAQMQIRSTVDSSIVLLEASTINGMITINGPAGIVMINVDAVVTAALTWNTGVYDLEVFTTAANTLRVLEGDAALSPEVTRP